MNAMEVAFEFYYLIPLCDCSRNPYCCHSGFCPCVGKPEHFCAGHEFLYLLGNCYLHFMPSCIYSPVFCGFLDLPGDKTIIMSKYYRTITQPVVNVFVSINIPHVCALCPVYKKCAGKPNGTDASPPDSCVRTHTSRKDL